jgi:hypothetical protein
VTNPKLAPCEAFVEQIPVYLSARAFEGRGAFVTHIAQCGGCRCELLESARLAKALAAAFEGGGALAPDYREVFAAMVGQLAEAAGPVPSAATMETGQAGSAELAVASSLVRGVAGVVRGVKTVSSAGYWAGWAESFGLG